MYQFREDLKTYLESCFDADNDISQAKKPKVYNGYQIQHEPSQTQPEIQIETLSCSENIDFSTFLKKNANNEPLQVTVYTGQLSINSLKYSAQDASVLLAEKVEKYIYDYIYSRVNKNIKYGQMVSASPALPMNDGGSVYSTALRFDFTVAYPYVTGNE